MATYYVANSGSDSNNGTSTGTPWQTITKVNAASLNPGDSVLFNRGDTFYGSLTISHAGTSVNNITFGAYGTGANPILTGFVTTSGWVNAGGGIWTYTDSGLGSTVNVVTVNGTVQGYGRFPKTGYNTYSTFSGTTSITDSGLSNSPSYVGGEVVIRKTHYTLTRGTISGQSSGVITYSAIGGGTQTPTANFGYFIQNHINCCTQLFDWTYNPATYTISMYFGANNPTSYTILASKIDTVVSFSGTGKNYNYFNNLTVQGGNSYNFNLAYYNTNCTITNCNIYYAGIKGVLVNTGSQYNTISTCVFNNCVNNSIFCADSVNNTIYNNQINNTAVVPGLAQSSDGSTGYGAETAITVAYASTCTGNSITYNTITNVGGSGLFGALKTGNTIQYNQVTNTNTVLDDGGGLYFNISGVNSSSNLIDSNIIYSLAGANTGTTTSGAALTHGIYFDTASIGFTCSNNVCYNCSYSGMYLHGTSYGAVTGNIFYNNGYTQVYMQDNAGTKPNNMTITGNVLFAKSGQLIYFLANYTNITVDLATSIGTINNNAYCRPSGETNDIVSHYTTDHLFSLSTWQSTYGYDGGSNITPTNLGNAELFVTNPSTPIQTLTGTWTDMFGNSKNGTISIPSYSAILLLQTSTGGGATILIYGIKIAFV